VRFVAGGFGITPILAMISAAEARGIDWSLVYAGRTADRCRSSTTSRQFDDRVVVLTE